MLSDKAALLAAVFADPDDDTPRLVYADCLQENGEEKRAAFIRAQVEMARRTPADPEYAPFGLLAREAYRDARVRRGTEKDCCNQLTQLTRQGGYAEGELTRADPEREHTRRGFPVIYYHASSNTFDAARINALPASVEGLHLRRGGHHGFTNTQLKQITRRGFTALTIDTNALEDERALHAVAVNRAFSSLEHLTLSVYKKTDAWFDVTTARILTESENLQRLKSLTFDYPITEGGLGMLLGAESLRHTLIHLDESDEQARGFHPEIWQRLTAHNIEAAAAQGCEYTPPSRSESVVTPHARRSRGYGGGR